MSEKKTGLGFIIGASSVGTLIEWYDFYIFGSLAGIIATKFFPAGNPTAALLSTLATFAAGFVVRPFGALFFGRLGDLIGRKHTFLLTLVLMGVSTFLIGCIPSYESIGALAPALVLLLRLLQGLALGGEYGGAATYVAEHAPANKRGYWTAWIQTTASLGLLVSLLVIYAARKASGDDFEAEWGGWRWPFWISILMVLISIIIRMNMSESPLFAKIKSEGKISSNPLKESFGNKYNFKYVLLALLGATMGQGVIWYTGQFYALSFIQNTLDVNLDQSSTLVATALILGTPFFIFFGWLSDKIGRKWIMLGGMLLGVLFYRNIYEKMYETTDLKNKTALPDKTTIQTKAELIKKAGIETRDSLYTTTTLKEYKDKTIYKETKKVIVLADKSAEAQKPEIKKMLTNINDADWTKLMWLVFIQVIFVTMAYGPIAAFLVEMFPTKIRYTSMSLPYHIGNGVFGGLMPAIATALATAAKVANDKATEVGTTLPFDKPYLEGLWYPIIISSVCLIIGTLYVKEDRKVED